MKEIKRILNGVLAGIMIVIGATVYLACENKYVGALFFSVALIVICSFSYSLFTGKIGFIVENHKKDDISILLLGLLGNLFGTVVFGYLIKIALPSIYESAVTLCQNKLSQTTLETLVRGIFCGVLMYVAVYIYQNKKTYIGIIFAIPVFILCGFEHSIADMAYFAISGIISFEAFIFIIMVILGNAIGSIIISLITYLTKTKN